MNFLHKKIRNLKFWFIWFTQKEPKSPYKNKLDIATREFAKEIDISLWIEKIIYSCETIEQLKSARKLLALYCNKYSLHKQVLRVAYEDQKEFVICPNHLITKLRDNEYELLFIADY